MPEVTIRVREHGPLVVTGDVKLVDAAGNPIEIPAGKPNVALCRCGASLNKPFCDGAHKTCEHFLHSLGIAAPTPE
ncbi:Iron-binding zinc finger CDGSH type [Anatilimnocola aggregata]|uniref:Iron-binding zinc finger CDGSH type n=1 Tax=Anatilimnocola aggregata TaxID=2528021 RepID=A0A517YEN1_9BACT|nr:CDGSH iron-sulfur domain-containing protein [Anatilimnocola aggregata]QDU28700.1 Iron-binding zinc finger CDGSH type [Anatilimnocola aggregata]